TDVVHPRQPDLRTVRANLMLEARLRDQRHDRLANPAPSPRGILRHQPLDAGALPVTPQLPDVTRVSQNCRLAGLMPYCLAYSTTASCGFTRSRYRAGIPGALPSRLL